MFAVWVVKGNEINLKLSLSHCYHVFNKTISLQVWPSSAPFPHFLIVGSVFS